MPEPAAVPRPGSAKARLAGAETRLAGRVRGPGVCTAQEPAGAARPGSAKARLSAVEARLAGRTVYARSGKVE
jgi:hypothetical protein